MNQIEFMDKLSYGKRYDLQVRYNGFNLYDVEADRAVSRKEAGIIWESALHYKFYSEAIWCLEQLNDSRATSYAERLKPQVKPMDVEFKVGDVLAFCPFGVSDRVSLVKVQKVTEPTADDYRTFYHCSSVAGDSVTNTATAGSFINSKYYDFKRTAHMIERLKKKYYLVSERENVPSVYEFPAPSNCTALWNADDWIKSINLSGRWTFPNAELTTTGGK